MIVQRMWMTTERRWVQVQGDILVEQPGALEGDQTRKLCPCPQQELESPSNKICLRKELRRILNNDFSNSEHCSPLLSNGSDKNEDSGVRNGIDHLETANVYKQNRVPRFVVNNFKTFKHLSPPAGTGFVEHDLHNDVFRVDNDNNNLDGNSLVSKEVTRKAQCGSMGWCTVGPTC